MQTPILATKLFAPRLREQTVARTRLVERLNTGLSNKLTLVSASAGYGKTTLVSEWIASLNSHRVGWFSLDSADGDPSRFLAYLLAALQKAMKGLGADASLMLAAPQPPPPEAIITSLVNELSTLTESILLVLDDYHSIDSPQVDQIISFLLENQPGQLHLVITTREDPNLPLARLRARSQLNELRAVDLRFTNSEASDFLRKVMGLQLGPEETAALEKRTEGWIAGLQLAALAMQGQDDTSSFIESFTGSHRFVLDYLLEEVLQQQSPEIYQFLLRTSILSRMCGPLCDALLQQTGQASARLLETLERDNLFVIPLDQERRWYRYHHLFADFLKQRLLAMEAHQINEYHIRASEWLGNNGLEFEAFQHAVLANDIPRAERLTELPGMPRHFRSVANTIIAWVDGLPKEIKDARPSLWLRGASIRLVAGQTAGVAELLLATESSLQNQPENAVTRNLAGSIAAARSTLALTQYRPDEIFVQAGRALELLAPDSLGFRFTAHWTMGFAHFMLGDRQAALRTYQQSLTFAKESGEFFSLILAAGSAGTLQILENQLREARQTYEMALPQSREHLIPAFTDAYLGMGRIHYEWNQLELATEYAEKSLHLAHQYDHSVDRYLLSEALLACIYLTQGNQTAAAPLLRSLEQAVKQPDLVRRMPEAITDLVTALIKRGDPSTALGIAEMHQLPLSQAQAILAQNKPAQAQPILAAVQNEMKTRGWKSEELKACTWLALAQRALGQKEEALQTIDQALVMAQPGGFIRLFLDGADPMRLLLAEWKTHNKDAHRGSYVEEILAAFPRPGAASSSVESLTPRELEVLQLIAQGSSNQEIGEKLFLALSTVKGYNQKIFDKLQAQSRTEAVARAREQKLI